MGEEKKHHGFKVTLGESVRRYCCWKDCTGSLFEALFLVLVEVQSAGVR